MNINRLKLLLFPPNKHGHYLQLNAKGEYLTYCNTTGEPFYTTDRECAIRYNGADNLPTVLQNIKSIWTLTPRDPIVKVELIDEN